MNDQFDRNIRSRIYPVETDVPDSAWQAVELQLRPRKSRRWLFLFLLPAVFAIYWASKQLGSKDYMALSAASYRAKSIVTENDSDASKPIIQLSTDGSDNHHQDPSNASNASRPGQQKITLKTNGPIETSKITSPTNNLSIKQSRLTGLPLNPTVTDKSIEKVFPGNTQSEIEDPSSFLVKETKIEGIPSLDFLPQTALRDPKIDVCPSFSTSVQIRPFLELLLSGGLPSKYYTLRETELSNYQTLRERTEKERTSFTLQALVGADIGDRFEVKAGLGATQIFEVFDYIDESATRTITNIITDTVIVDGVPRIRTDTSIVTQYGQRIKLSQNRYTALELPVLATYKFKVQNHQFFIQGGAIVNLALWTKGDILTSDEQITSIDTKESRSYPIFRSRTGLDITASLGYELELSESHKLRLLCSFRQTMGDFTASAYPLGQRYNHYHLGVSWKHQF
jgi:hypothetical protein